MILNQCKCNYFSLQWIFDEEINNWNIWKVLPSNWSKENGHSFYYCIKVDFIQHNKLGFTKHSSDVILTPYQAILLNHSQHFPSSVKCSGNRPRRFSVKRSRRCSKKCSGRLSRKKSKKCYTMRSENCFVGNHTFQETEEKGYSL